MKKWFLVVGIRHYRAFGFSFDTETLITVIGSCFLFCCGSKISANIPPGIPRGTLNLHHKPTSAHWFPHISHLGADRVASSPEFNYQIMFHGRFYAVFFSSSLLSLGFPITGGPTPPLIYVSDSSLCSEKWARI